MATNRLTQLGLAQAELAQETELASWTIAELLIHLELADEPTVAALAREQALADLTDLCNWPGGSWRFRRRSNFGRHLPHVIPVEDAIAAVDARRAEWQELLPHIGGPEAVVTLAAHPEDGSEPAPDSVKLDADAFALLCGVDGSRTLGELSAAAGFTLLDGARHFAELARTGLVQIAHEHDGDELLRDDDVPAETADDAEPGEDEPALDAIAAAFSWDSDEPLLPPGMRRGFAPEGAAWQPPKSGSGDVLADALARVSAALSDAMTSEAAPTARTTIDDSPEAAPAEPMPVEDVPLEAADAADADEGDILITDDSELADVIPLTFAPQEPADAEMQLEVARDETAEESELAHDEPEAPADAEVATAVEVGLQAEALPQVEGAPQVEPTAEVEIQVGDETELADALEAELEGDTDTDTDTDEVALELAALAAPQPELAELIAIAELPEPDELTEHAEQFGTVEAHVDDDIAGPPEMTSPTSPRSPRSPRSGRFTTCSPNSLPMSPPSRSTRLRSWSSSRSLWTRSRRSRNLSRSRSRSPQPARGSGAAAFFLSELVGEGTRPTAPAAEPDPVPEPEPAAPAAYTPSPRREETDTAALMRELSSLGSESGGGSRPGPTRPAAPVPTPQHRKRKGLFGRG